MEIDEKKLRKLNREQLLELLLEMSEEKDRLQEQLDTTRAALEKRDAIMKDAGSIADVAAKITGILDKAQETADLYLESVKKAYPLPDPDPADWNKNEDAEEDLKELNDDLAHWEGDAASKETEGACNKQEEESSNTY